MMTKTNVNLPQQQLAELDRLAKERGISRSELVRRVLELGLRALAREE